MKTTTKPLLLPYFALAFGFSWAIWLLGILAGRALIPQVLPGTALTMLGAFGPLVAALALTYREEGWAGVRRLFSAAFCLRMGVRWWAVILLLPFVLAAGAVWMNMQINGYQPDRTLLAQPWLILPTFLALFFLGGSLQEELGWRGFALPRLLQRWNAVQASLILGAIWGVWHLPLFFIPDTGQYFMPFGVFLQLAICFSILFTWFYVKTKGNLFSALLFHTAINTSLSVFPPIEKVAGGNQLALSYLLLLYALAAGGLLLWERGLFFGQRRLAKAAGQASLD